MDCYDVRESLSAALDGEISPISSELTAAHVRGCAACRDWQSSAREVGRQIRLSSVSLDHFYDDHDLSDAVLTRLAPQATPPLLQRASLLLIGIAQLAITIPLLLLGHDSEGTRHVAHELGSFDLALAVAFVVGALRPRLSSGLAWPCGFAAAGLLATALIDIGLGETPGVDELQHGVAVVGAALLFWGARASARAESPRFPSLAHAS
jgi:predicted anti-sigma-YlaC factor YlaD